MTLSRPNARQRADADQELNLWWIQPATIEELSGLLKACRRPLTAYHRIGELIARVHLRGSSPFDGTGWSGSSPLGWGVRHASSVVARLWLSCTHGALSSGWRQMV